MRLLIENRSLPKGYYVGDLLSGITKAIKEKYPQHEYIPHKREQFASKGNGGVYSATNLIITNEENGLYILFGTHYNWKQYFSTSSGWKPENMVKWFYTSGFNYLDYFNFTAKHSEVKFPKDITKTYQQIYYGPFMNKDMGLMTELYKNRNPTKQKMIFRGWLQDFRKKMVVGIKDNKEIDIFDVRDPNANKSSKLSYELYLKDMSDYTCSLSLPGATEICNRDIESFGIGLPVIRPLLHTKYENPLIPNFHYISCYEDCKYWNGTPYYPSFKEVGEYAAVYWNMVKNNEEYLNFISENARNWYLENTSLDNHLKYIMSKLDLEILNV